MNELEQLRDLNERINTLLEEQSILRSRLFYVSGVKMSDQVSGTKINDLSAAITKLVDLEKRIDNLIDEYVDKRDEIVKKIDKIKDYRYRKILHCYYICGMTLAEIAKKTHFSYHWTKHLHLDALRAYEMIK